jgi:hypothetical protein
MTWDAGPESRHLPTTAFRPPQPRQTKDPRQHAVERAVRVEAESLPVAFEYECAKRLNSEGVRRDRAAPNTLEDASRRASAVARLEAERLPVAFEYEGTKRLSAPVKKRILDPKIARQITAEDATSRSVHMSKAQAKVQQPAFEEQRRQEADRRSREANAWQLREDSARRDQLRCEQEAARQRQQLEAVFAEARRVSADAARGAEEGRLAHEANQRLLRDNLAREEQKKKKEKAARDAGKSAHRRWEDPSGR